MLSTYDSVNQSLSPRVVNQSLSFATNFGSTTQRPRRFDCFALVEAGGVARLSLRPARASAIAARRRADALPCVALFLLLVGALRRFDSPWTPPSAKRPIPCGTWRIGPSVRLVDTVAKNSNRGGDAL
jgi:hypothetical protein